MVAVLVAQVSGMAPSSTFSCPRSSAAGDGRHGHRSGDVGAAPRGWSRGSDSEAFRTNFTTGKRFTQSWACVLFFDLLIDRPDRC